MRNHPTTAARADIGRTPQLCQDALIEMLKELFAGKLFCGQEGRKALKIYKPAKVCQEVKAENLNKNNCCRVQ